MKVKIRSWIEDGQWWCECSKIFRHSVKERSMSDREDAINKAIQLFKKVNFFEKIKTETRDINIKGEI